MGDVIGGAFGWAFGPVGVVAGVTVGSTLGGLIGDGIDNLMGEQRQQEGGLGPNRQPHNLYPIFNFNGDVNGRLDLHFYFHQK